MECQLFCSTPSLISMEQTQLYTHPQEMLEGRPYAMEALWLMSLSLFLLQRPTLLTLGESEALGSWADSQGPAALKKAEAEFESRSCALCNLARCPPLWVRSRTDGKGGTSGFWQARAKAGGSKTQGN